MNIKHTKEILKYIDERPVVSRDELLKEVYSNLAPLPRFTERHKEKFHKQMKKKNIPLGSEVYMKALNKRFIGNSDEKRKAIDKIVELLLRDKYIELIVGSQPLQYKILQKGIDFAHSNFLSRNAIAIAEIIGAGAKQYTAISIAYYLFYQFL